MLLFLPCLQCLGDTLQLSLKSVLKADWAKRLKQVGWCLVARLKHCRQTCCCRVLLPVEHGYSDSVLALSLNAQLVGECQGMYDSALGQQVSGAAERLHLCVCGPQWNLKHGQFDTWVDLLWTQARPACNFTIGGLLHDRKACPRGCGHFALLSQALPFQSQTVCHHQASCLHQPYVWEVT